ncbi:MAG: cell division protein ZapE [Cycloclasticus sp.]|nr:cell division protein ZapE [Cycloclasticus sp.]MBG97295.1 cell division protein ZapE [Cycloclasticus sp.]HAI97868.1 cell division protein ZapE [Methylococcaceae bacterium]
MSPLERYLVDQAQNSFIKDNAQKAIVERLNTLYKELRKSPAQQVEKKGFFSKFKNSPKTMLNSPKGVYLWGGVGQGKTYLMDIFFDALPFKEKQRTHFHRFMQKVHQQLSTIKNVEDPLQIVADKIAVDYRVVCFDEFFVSDITDAMLLGRLFEALFKRGVCLVATSNIEPDGLYKDGLQRARFLPAIAALKKHCDVLKLDSGTDYRLRELEQAEIYHWPLDQQADTVLSTLFKQLTANDVEPESNLEIEGRIVEVIHCAEGAVWFDYKSICDIPRGAADYIDISRCYHTVLVSNVVVMNDMNNDMANRFINLVDELYDHNVKLIMSAEVPVDKLYQGKKLAFQFERTISRLLEMQSHEYLERPHLP